MSDIQAISDEDARAIVAVLAADFPGLGDPVTADIVLRAVQRRAAEIILDDPISANWRLVSGHRSGRLRLACYRLHVTEADHDLLYRVNAALDALEER
jgi:hypothetical protein